jgi:excinuclease UvrABC nuclease subunit
MKTLLVRGFQLTGSWRTPHCKVHRAPWLRDRPGVYVFVVAGLVMYVGETEKPTVLLRRRLRNYSSRCFGPPGRKQLRKCHAGIRGVVARGGVVEVYAKVVVDPGVLERQLIREFDPPWNDAR